MSEDANNQDPAGEETAGIPESTGPIEASNSAKPDTLEAKEGINQASKFLVSQEVFVRHAQRLWSMEAHIENLPDGAEKESLKADFQQWHKELAEDYGALTDANGTSPQPLSGGTSKGTDPSA